jgi:L-malate glycosyltransferase
VRVLHVIDALSVGGAERHVVDVARAQAARGDEVAVACSARGPLGAELDGTGVTVHVLGDRLVKRRTDARYARALRRLAGELRPDLVHAHLFASIVAAALAAARRPFGLVVTEQTEAPWRGARARLASRVAYRRADHVIGVSDRIRAALVEDFGVPDAKATTIPNAVALEAREARAPLPAWARAGGGAPAVGVCGRLVPEKGVDVFLDAVAELAPRFPGAVFPVVGDGPLRDELQARAHDLGLGDRVPFAGLRGDCRALLPHLDVLAVPSRSEGTPLTIVEAMLAGVPIVAAAVGGIPQQIEDGRTGLLVRPEDPAALAAAVALVVDDPNLAARLTEAARAHARVEFHPDTMLRRLDAVYAAATAPAVARGRPRPRRVPVPARPRARS